jgi:predicted MFS family arabinose efflux permease
LRPPGGAHRPLHYAWVVFGATLVVLLLAAGFRASPAVLIDPLQDEFGWSKADVGFAVSVNVLLYGLTGPFAAALLARFGLRRVVPSALVLVATGSGLAAVVQTRWQLVLCWGVLVGIGTGCMATVLAATVANRWFVERRGLVMGALTAASATGQVIFLQFFTQLTDGPGWRWVPLVVTMAALLAAPIALLVLRDRPEDMGLRAYGAPPGYATPEPSRNPIRTAFEGLGFISRLGGFWLLFGGFLICGVSTNGLIQTHFISAAHDHEISRAASAAMLSAIGLFDIVGTLASGWLTDRYDPRRLLGGYYALRGLSLLVLDPALATGHGPMWGFIAFYGLDWVATVPPTVKLCAEVCGPERATVAYGWVFAGHQIGAALAAWGAGYLRDQTGSYQLAFVIAGALCLVAALGSQRIGRVVPEPVTFTAAPA